MKKNVLVTLADENYIDQAKQLFSSAYHNAGWKGDYLLLAHEIPENKLKWFRDKGIIIKKCKPLLTEKIEDRWELAVLDTLFLFSIEFKKWINVIYLDADMIIRANLDELTKKKGLYVFKGDDVLSNKFKKKNLSLLDEIGRKKLKRKSFGTGIIAFSTDLIKEDTFSKLIYLLDKYKRIIRNDESIICLYFYKTWKEFSDIYNVCVNFVSIKPEDINGIVLHFAGNEGKPWHIENHFHNEWKGNLDKADLIDLDNIPEGNKWSKQRMKKYGSYLRRERFFRRFYEDIYRRIGLAGIFLKKYLPSLYKMLKKQDKLRGTHT